MKGLKDKMLRDMGYTKDGWKTDYTGVLICPHGERVEDDGETSCGCVSPLKRLGMV